MLIHLIQLIFEKLNKPDTRKPTEKRRDILKKVSESKQKPKHHSITPKKSTVVEDVDPDYEDDKIPDAATIKRKVTEIQRTESK